MLDRKMREALINAKKVLVSQGITEDLGISYYNMLQMMTASFFIEHNKKGVAICSPTKEEVEKQNMGAKAEREDTEEKITEKQHDFIRKLTGDGYGEFGQRIVDTKDKFICDLSKNEASEIISKLKSGEIKGGDTK